MSDIKITAEELKSLIAVAVDEKAKEVVSAKIAELGLEKSSKRFEAFMGKTSEELAGLTAKEKIATFIKAVFNKDIGTLSTMKALVEGTNSAGG